MAQRRPATHSIRFHFLLPTFLFASLIVAGCTEFVRPGQSQISDGILLRQDNPVGQSFVSQYDGLEGVELYLAPEQAGDGLITFHLRSDPRSSQDLAVSTLSVNAVAHPGYYRFANQPLRHSRRGYYYSYLEIEGSGSVQVGASSGESYLEGALYENHESLDRQAAFRLVYEPRQLTAGLARLALSWIGVLLAGISFFILPGWVLLSLLWNGWRSAHWAERLALAAGISLAIYPLLILWTGLIGLRLGPLYAWLPPVAALSLLIFRQFRPLTAKLAAVGVRPIEFQRPQTAAVSVRFTEKSLPDLALLAVIGMVIFTRFWVVRNLEAPMWGDSYQHTLIAQLLVDNKGLFDSWQPYAELETFTYHFGFHSAAAVFHWATNLDLPASTLWTGQLFNVLAVVSLFPLATRIGRNRWAGVLAVVLAGLVSPMPMTYVNWGRYTQLAGQVILPAAIYLSWDWLETPPGEERRWSRSLLILCWVLVAGLALTHYRVLIFGILFFVAFLFINSRRGRMLSILARLEWLAAGAGLLFLPWFLHVLPGEIIQALAGSLSTPASQVSEFTRQSNAIGDLFVFLPSWMWLLLPLAVAWSLWRREKGAMLFSLWWFLVLLAANPDWLNLPGQGLIGNFTLFIAAYIPVGILAGVAMAWGLEGITGSTPWDQYRRLRAARFFSAVIPLGLFGVLLLGFIRFGVLARLRDVEIPQYTLVTRPDIRAASWIRENTPETASFLVNSFFAYGDTLVVGSDAGWWLPVLAGRKTTLPPLNYGAERGPGPDYLAETNRLTKLVRDKGLDDPEVLRLLLDRNISHVFIGQQQGRVNNPGPVLEPQRIEGNPNFRVVYHQDRVWVFEMTP